MLANRELYSVSGKWEGSDTRARSAETTGQISEERLTSTLSRILIHSVQAWHIVRSASAGPERLLWRTNSLPLLSDFMGTPQGLIGAPEERWASWQGQTAKSQDFQVPRVLPIIPRPRGWDEESLILLFFPHVFFNPWAPLLSTQTRAVLRLA